jgi:GT2 family glycosyltransferase
MSLSGSLVLYDNDPRTYERAIISFIEACDGDLYVVDNSEPPLENEIFNHARVVYINTGRNLGFGAGHNFAIHHMRQNSKFHLIMNPDVSFQKNVLSDLIDVLNSDQKIGAIMPRINYPGGNMQRLCKLLPTPIDLIFRRFFPSSAITKMINSSYELHGLSVEDFSEVTTISGCFFIAKTELMTDLGGFDERFFMYMEDVDLSRRIGQREKLIFYPKVTIEHQFSKGSYHNYKLLGYHIQSAVKYFNKWGWIFDSSRRKKNSRMINVLRFKCNRVTDRVGIFLGVSPSAGGMFQYSQSILEALNSANHPSFQVTVVYCSLDWVPVLKRLGVNGVRLYSSKIGMTIATLFMILRIPGPITRILGLIFNPLIWEIKLKRCRVWVFPAQDVLSWQVFGIKSIGTIHDLMHRYQPDFPEVNSWFRYGIREHRFSNISKYCEAVLVDSIIGKKHVIESYGVEGEKVHSLPYIAPNYLKSEENEDMLSRKYLLPRKFLFYPSQFWLHKNHRRLIDAIKIICKNHPDIFLVLSGGRDKNYKQILQYAKDSNIENNISFTGYVPEADLRYLYKRARALVYPTFFGPTNIPPLEAMVLGCPVVVSNIYGMPEQCGDAALYFSPDNVSEMSSAIEKVWVNDQLAQEMRKKGFDLSLNNDQARFSKDFGEILQNLTLNSQIQILRKKFSGITDAKSIKISIVTAVLNREKTIRNALKSVQSQKYDYVEHLIVDGVSGDKTLDIVRANAQSNTILITKPDKGIYDAINRGIKHSTGEVIGLLHSDDVFADEFVLDDVARAFEDPEIEAVYGDLEYVAQNNPDKVLRYWRAGSFSINKILNGWMPPHPSLFIRRSVFERMGGYDIAYKISGDYDAILRYFFHGRISSTYIPRSFVKMSLGGESNKSIENIWVKMTEDYRALSSNNISPIPCLIYKNLVKIPQFFISPHATDSAYTG